MSKHHEEDNEIFELMESPEALINSVITSKEDKQWALDEIIYGGPKHKQAYSALLLNRMHELVKVIELQNGKKFSVQKGIILTSKKDEAKVNIPLVLKSVKKQHQDSVIEILAHAPAHEIIAFNTLLQAIEWSIAALNKSSL